MTQQLKAALDRLEQVVWPIGTDDDIGNDEILDAAIAVLEAAGREPRSHCTDD